MGLNFAGIVPTYFFDEEEDEGGGGYRGSASNCDSANVESDSDYDEERNNSNDN